MDPIKIRIEGENDFTPAQRQALAELNALADAAKKDAAAARQAANEKKQAYEMAARAARDASSEGKSAARQAANALKDEYDAANKTASALEEVAKAANKQAAGAIRDTTKAIEEQRSAAQKLSETKANVAGTVRNIGAGAAVAGVGGLALGADLANDYQEGSGASAKVDAMFKKIGDTDAAVSDLKENLQGLAFDAAMPDDDPLNRAAAGLAGFGVKAEQVKGIMPGLIGQSRLYGLSLDSVSEAFGKAFASGNVGALRRTGVVISDADAEKIKNITDEGERQKAVYEAVKGSLDKYALSITEGMSAAEIAANRNALAIDGIREALGAGTSEAKNELDGLGISLLKLVGSNPELAKTTGYIFEMGSGALAGVGGVAAFGGQLYLAAQGGKEFVGWLKELKAARIAASEAEAAATAITTTNSASLGTNSGATLAEATAKDIEALAEGGNTEATAENTAAKAANTAASATATGAAGFLGTAFSLAGTAAAGLGIAAAAATVGIIYGCGQAIGAISKEQSFVDRLAAGWQRVRDYATSHEGRFDANQQDLQAGIQQIKEQAAADVVSGKKTQEVADKDSRQAQAKLYEDFAKEDLRVGDKEHLVSDAAAAAQLRAQDKALANIPSVPNAPAAAALTASPSTAVPLTASAPTAAGTDSLGLSSGGTAATTPSIDATDEQILQLKAQIRAAGKDKALKNQLQTQLDALNLSKRQQLKTSRDAERQAKKEEADAKRQEKAMVKTRETGEREDLAVEKNRRDIALEDQTDALSDQLETAKKAKNTAQIKALTTRIETLKARAKFEDAMATAAVEDDARKRASMETIARDDLDHELRRANRAGNKAIEEGAKGNSSDSDEAIRRRIKSRHDMAGASYGLTAFGRPVIGNAIRAGGGNLMGTNIPLPTLRRDGGTGYVPMDGSGMRPNGGNKDLTFRNYKTTMGANGVIKLVSEIELDSRQFSLQAQRGRRPR